MENSYTVRDLLLFSSVCGVGLDTVPIPGDVSVESLTGVLMETGTMAYRLNKPLSVRYIASFCCVICVFMFLCM